MLALVNGAMMHYTITGDYESRAIVLIHGFPFSSTMWDSQVNTLSEMKNLSIVTYDIRGHGNSEVGDGQYNIELFVDDLIALLDHLKINKTILCGFSMGGYIALRAIERISDRFSALILCDTQSVADSNEVKIKRANSIKLVKTDGVAKFAEGFLKVVFAPKTFSERPEIVEETRKTILSNSPLGISGALLAMAARTETTEGLSKINVPTLIMVGENDEVTPPSAAKVMQNKIQNSKLCIIDKAAHMSNLENPQVFNEQLANFVISAENVHS